MNVIYRDLPHGIRGVVVKKDGNYCILINSRYSFEQQRKTLEHELKHISDGDFLKSSMYEAERKNDEETLTTYCCDDAINSML